MKLLTVTAVLIGAASFAAPSLAQQQPATSSRLAPEAASTASGARPMEAIQVGSARTTTEQTGQSQSGEASKQLSLTPSNRQPAKK